MSTSRISSLSLVIYQLFLINYFMGKPRLLIIGHGGTITMHETGKGLMPALNVSEILKLVPGVSEVAEIDLIQLDNIDSTNINESHWSKLLIEISEKYGVYDGILVTHGTDTMAYTATAVSLGLGRGLQIPIVFTGSQLPLTTFETDARVNLERSVNTLVRAIEQNFAEVMIVFNDRVLRANRSIKTSEARFDAFDSPAFPHLGDITATGVTFAPSIFTKLDNDTTTLHSKFDSDIVCLELVPGIKPSMIRNIITSGECHGLLLKSLGAGNVPNFNERSLIPVIEQAVQLNIPVLITTKFVGGNVRPEIYEVGQAALDAGAIPTGDMTDVTAQIKLMFALAQGITTRSELAEFILTDIVGEIS